MNQATAARRQHISEIVAQGQKPNVNELAKGFGVHPTTIYSDLRKHGTTKAPIQEMIERGGYPTAVNYNRWKSLTRTVDYTQVNYAFWNKIPRGKAAGYEIGGLFAQPIVKILVSAAFGEGAKVCVKSKTPRAADETHPIDDAMNDEFMAQNRKLITDIYYNMLILGDTYAAVNPDTSITPVEPTQVELDTDPLLWRTINRVTITTKSDKSSVTDSYTAETRQIKIKVNGIPAKDGQPAIEAREDTLDYPNLIGRIPVVHFAYGREPNELYGHPYYEALLTLFAEYDDIIRKSAMGVKAMGRPLPVVEGLEDPNSVLEANTTSTERFMDGNGQWQERDVIDFDGLDILLLGPGASFKFASPGAFTQDAGNLLEYLFLLMLQHARIPEWVWGGAVNSSMASVSAQTPAWHDVIRGLRSDFELTLIQLAEIWLAMKSLTDPSLTLKEGETLVVEWPELDAKDEALRWQKLTNMRELGDITPETYVAKSDEIEDAEEEVKKAKEQAKAEQDEFNARLETEANDQIAAGRAQFGQDNQDDTEEKAA